jgi:uncharacterized damage-inducible protein DinB
MITKEQLAEGYALNLRLVKMHTAGLSHADSLILSPYNINCMNWVVGHIAVSRDSVMRLMGAETLLSETETLRYKTDSDPVTEDGPDILHLDQLLEVLIAGQSRIDAAMDRLTNTDLAQEIQVGERMVTLGTRLHSFYFHDTYHTGQTELLRQIAGRNDIII